MPPLLFRQLSAATLVAAFLFSGPSSPAQAQLSFLETENLRLVYFDPAESYLAPYVARCFENSMQFQRELFDYEPWERVSVLLTDFSDAGNAGASPVPRNRLSVEIAPLDFAYETIIGNERMNTIMNHELVHIVAQDKAAASDRRFRRLFGGKVLPTPDHPETILYFYLTTPRVAAPSWYQEGLAVFIDTWMAGGQGRAQGAWDEMVFRSMVRDDSRFYDPLGLVAEGTKIDFQVGVNAYLYGTRFMSYLAYHYSPESLIRWVSRRDGTKRYYAAQFKEVFGEPLPEVWREWVEWEHDFQERNLAAIRRFPTTPYRDISQKALGSISRAYFDPRAQKIFAAFNYPGVAAHIGAISVADGTVEKIIDVKDPVVFTVTSMAYDPGSRTLFYTTDNSEYRDIRALDPESGDSTVLLKDARIGDLAFNPADRSLWGIRHFNGIATLVRIPHPYEQWFQVYSWPYGEVVYNLDVSPDGHLLSASVGEINGQQTLRVMQTASLLAGDPTPVAKVDFGAAIPSNFVFSPDGRYLYGSSYYTGVSNIFRYEIDADALEAVSNTETGFFRPIPLEDDDLIVFRYTGEGFVAATIEAKPLEDASAITFFGQQVIERHPDLETWNVGSPADIPLDSLTEETGEYGTFGNLRPETFYPVIEGYKDYAAYGLRFNLSDPVGINSLSLTASYTPDEKLPADERHHLHLQYQRYDWRVGFKLNDADFYDLFGPTKTSRKGYSLSVGYDRTLINDRPRKLTLSLDGSFYGDLERLPNYQNIDAPFDKLLSTEASLSYTNVRSSLGGVDAEKGHKWEILAGNSYVNGENIPGIVVNADVGLALPLGHSSVWLRSSAGVASGDRDDPFANFYFGGFGNNWVDHRGVKRYREYYAFPGAELNEINGRSFAKAMLEWNLPPLRFRRLGTPGFYVSWARPALFVTGLTTNPDSTAERREIANAGVQVDFRFTLLSRLDLTLSVGYAEAFESGVDSRDEFMASLKILR